MQKDMFRKGLVCGILFVLVSISIMPMAGSNLSIGKYVSTEKPVADCSTVGDSGLSLVTVMLVGETGEDDWYGCDHCFTMTYESDDIASIYYGLEGVWFNYTKPFKVTDDGDDINLEWYAVDHEGNKSEVDGPFVFNVDQTPPNVPDYISGEEFQENGEWYIRFWVNCTDSMSGMDRVEWYFNGKLAHTVEGPGPRYEWIIEYGYYYYCVFRATAYDKAGNSDYVEFTWYPPPDDLGPSLLFAGIVEEDSQKIGQDLVPSVENTGKENYVSGEKTPSGCSLMDGFELSSLVVVVNREMGNSDWVVSDVNITIIPDPDDITAVYYKVDDEDWSLYTDPLTISEDGYHDFSWYVVDDDGNPSTHDSISFKIDQTSPSIELTKEKVGIIKTKFTANVYDGASGIEKVEFFAKIHTFPLGVEYKDFTDYDFPYEWTLKKQKKIEMTAKVYDNAGNSNSDKVTTQYNQRWINQQFRNPLFLQILERFMNRFPLLEQLFNL